MYNSIRDQVQIGLSVEVLPKSRVMSCSAPPGVAAYAENGWKSLLSLPSMRDATINGCLTTVAVNGNQALHWSACLGASWGCHYSCLKFMIRRQHAVECSLGSQSRCVWVGMSNGSE